MFLFNFQVCWAWSCCQTSKTIERRKENEDFSGVMIGITTAKNICTLSITSFINRISLLPLSNCLFISLKALSIVSCGFISTVV